MRIDYIPVPPTEDSPNYAVTGAASPTFLPFSYFSFIMPFEFHVLTVTTLALGAGNMDGMLMMQSLCPRGPVLLITSFPLRTWTCVSSETGCIVRIKPLISDG